MSGKKRQRAKRDQALAGNRAWIEEHGGLGVIAPQPPKEAASLERLLGWAGALGFKPEPELRPMVIDGPRVWHLDLGTFISASLDARGDWDLCYGKGGACLDDGAGGTTSFEVEVARRLQAVGWEAGWWNNYDDRAGGRKVGPQTWRHGEVDKTELREVATRQLPRLASVLEPGTGIADVFAWRLAPEFDVIAAECKCLWPKRDTFKPSQVGWASTFVRKFGLGSYAVIEWRRATRY